MSFLAWLRDAWGVTVMVGTRRHNDGTDRVTIADGGTLGPNSVILPAARIGKHATVGPVSLVMRGESVPDKTRWIGNPVGPWTEDE